MPAEYPIAACRSGVRAANGEIAVGDEIRAA
jgi:hypothetical protein